MKHCIRVWFLGPLVLALVAAISVPDAYELVRRGDAAFDREDYGAAVDFYTQAEEAITDPGLVAFNKAAALYRLGRYREAELHCIRCLEDATGRRRPRALYGLANSLMQQAQDKDVRVLQKAIGFYEACLHDSDIDPDLAEDAQHNLELAKALFQRAKSAKNSQESEPSGSNDHNPGRDQDQEGDSRPVGMEENALSPDQIAWARGTAPPPGDRHTGEVPSDKTPPPGIGNLPPIPDTDQLVPMSPEDTAAYLEEVAARIWRERRQHWQALTPAAPSNMKNW